MERDARPIDDELIAARTERIALASIAVSELLVGIGPYDSIVAATALAHSYDVLTFNVREFERVQGLGVLRPDW